MWEREKSCRSFYSTVNVTVKGVLCSQWTRSSTPCPASCWNAPRTWSTNTGSYWLEKPRWELNELQRHLSGVRADRWCRVCNWGNVNLLPQQESPSAEMVMLERLFLQAERCALAEDRRRVRRDPGERPSGKRKPSASSSSLLHACL